MVGYVFVINRNEDIIQVVYVCNTRLMIMCYSVRYTTFIVACLIWNGTRFVTYAYSGLHRASNFRIVCLVSQRLELGTPGVECYRHGKLVVFSF